MTTMNLQTQKNKIQLLLNSFPFQKFHKAPDLHTLYNEFVELINGNVEIGDATFVDIYSYYAEPHRYYHGISHIQELFGLIDKIKNDYSPDFIFNLRILALFHDAEYNPRRDDNELQSAILFKRFVEKHIDGEMHAHVLGLRFEEIYQAILETKTHESKSELSEVFCALDMYVISHYPFQELLKYEHGIFKEYQFIPYHQYKVARADVLKKLNKDFNRKEIDNLIEYVEFRTPKVGVYAGSFRPFHIGHADILHEAEKMFDKVIIARGVNPSKESSTEFLTNLEETFPFNEVGNFTGYIFDYLNSLQQTGVEAYYIKGLRNSADYESQAKEDSYNRYLYTNRYLNKYDVKGIVPMKTVCILGSKMFSHISSSDIRIMEKIESGSGNSLIYKERKYQKL